MEFSLDWINAVVTLGGILVALGVFIQQSKSLAKSIDHLSATVEGMRREFSRKVDEIKSDAASARERMARLEEKINHRSGTYRSKDN